MNKVNNLKLVYILVKTETDVIFILLRNAYRKVVV